jgi:rRNA maturation endonuclease Nob1
MLNRFDAFHLQCIGCHQEFEVNPLEEQCELCHVM